MDLDRQLSTLAKQVGSLQAQAAREEGQLAALQDNQARITKACRGLGVEPDQLDTAIIEKEQELTKLLEKIDAELTQIEEKRGAILKDAGATTETG